MKLNRPQRFVSAEKLMTAATDLVRVEHELYRITHIHREGLTPKELEYLENTRQDIDRTKARIVALKTRLTQSCGDWWTD